MYLFTIQSPYCNLINHLFISFWAITEKNLLIKILRELVPGDGLFQSCCFYQPPRPGHIFQLNPGHFHLVLVRDPSWLRRSIMFADHCYTSRAPPCLKRLPASISWNPTCYLASVPGVQPVILGAGPSSVLVSLSSYFCRNHLNSTLPPLGPF